MLIEWRMGEVCQWGSFVWFSGGLFSRVLYCRWNWPSDTICYCIQWIGIYFELVQDQYHSSVVYLEQEYYGYSRLFVGMLGLVMCHCWWRARLSVRKVAVEGQMVVSATHECVCPEITCGPCTCFLLFPLHVIYLFM